MYEALEILPTNRLDFLFVSLHPVDVSRAASDLQTVDSFGVPLRFEAGEKRAETLRQCQGLLLVLSKTVLQEPFPQARSDYRLAQRYGKPVYVLLLDDIHLAEVPTDSLHWWLELRKEPCCPGWRPLVNRLQELYGPLETADARKQFYDQYHKLCNHGDYTEADDLLSAFLFRKAPGARAEILTQILSRGPDGQTAPAPLYKDTFFQRNYDTSAKKPVSMSGRGFYAETRTVFRRIGRGDADVIDIFRDGECIFTVPHLVDAWSICVIPSTLEEVIHICFASYPDVPDQHTLSGHTCMSVVIVEHPCEKAQFHVFMDPYCRMGFRPD